MVQLTGEAEFLRGDSTTDECEPLFKQYKTCLTVLVHHTILFSSLLAYASQKALKERGIDSMLDDARESNRENDAEHMKRSCKMP